MTVRTIGRQTIRSHTYQWRIMGLLWQTLAVFINRSKTDIAPRTSILIRTVQGDALSNSQLRSLRRWCKDEPRMRGSENKVFTVYVYTAALAGNNVNVKRTNTIFFVQVLTFVHSIFDARTHFDFTTFLSSPELNTWAICMKGYKKKSCKRCTLIEHLALINSSIGEKFQMESYWYVYYAQIGIINI